MSNTKSLIQTSEFKGVVNSISKPNYSNKINPLNSIDQNINSELKSANKFNNKEQQTNLKSGQRKIKLNFNNLSSNSSNSNVKDLLVSSNSNLNNNKLETNTKDKDLKFNKEVLSLLYSNDTNRNVPINKKPDSLLSINNINNTNNLVSSNNNEDDTFSKENNENNRVADIDINNPFNNIERNNNFFTSFGPSHNNNGLNSKTNTIRRLTFEIESDKDNNNIKKIKNTQINNFNDIVNNIGNNYNDILGIKENYLDSNINTNHIENYYHQNLNNKKNIQDLQINYFANNHNYDVNFNAEDNFLLYNKQELVKNKDNLSKNSNNNNNTTTDINRNISYKAKSREVLTNNRTKHFTYNNKKIPNSFYSKNNRLIPNRITENEAQTNRFQFYNKTSSSNFTNNGSLALNEQTSSNNSNANYLDNSILSNSLDKKFSNKNNTETERNEIQNFNSMLKYFLFEHSNEFDKLRERKINQTNCSIMNTTNSNILTFNKQNSGLRNQSFISKKTFTNHHNRNILNTTINKNRENHDLINTKITNKDKNNKNYNYNHSNNNCNKNIDNKLLNNYNESKLINKDSKKSNYTLPNTQQETQYNLFNNTSSSYINSNYNNNYFNANSNLERFPEYSQQQIEPSNLNFLKYTKQRKLDYLDNIREEIKCKQIISKITETNNYINVVPDKILDAPYIIDDFSYSLLDWSSSNLLATALSESVYLWNGNNNETKLLMKKEDNEICCIKWMQKSNIIAIGSTDSSIELWDADKHSGVRRMFGHNSGCKVTCLAWNTFYLASAGTDNRIIIHDVRIKNHLLIHLVYPLKDITNLIWNYNDTSCLVSCTKEGLITIWDLNENSNNINNNINSFIVSSVKTAIDKATYYFNLSSNYYNIENINNTINNTNSILSEEYFNLNNINYTYKIAFPKFNMHKHKMSLRAISFCPWERNILVSGGTDKLICIWSTDSGSLLNEVNIDSSIFSINWNSFDREIIFTHGQPNFNMGIWKFPELSKVIELSSHTKRALYACMSPDLSTIATTSADESIVFWKIFKNKNNNEDINNNCISRLRESQVTLMDIDLI